MIKSDILNKLKILEEKFAIFENNKIVILSYSTVNKKIKANICKGMKGFKNSVYFETIEDLKNFKKGNNVTFSIVGLDIDKI